MTSRERIHLHHRVACNNAMAAQRLKSAAVSSDPLRQAYHLMPPAGWMNDPCGMVKFRGEYHLFYQYDPYHARGRSMVFGHAKSRDLVHWEPLPVALAPSEEYELYGEDLPGTLYGNFTGSAVADGDRLVLLYCSSTYDEAGRPKQAVCLAESRDGVHFEKYERNPVIPAPPADGSCDFRDPKLWRHGDRWYTLVGSSKDGLGEVLLYTSETLTEWTYLGVAARSDGRFGSMWECPDFFPLDGKDVLLFSPIGMEQVDTCYQVGRMDYETGVFTMEAWGSIDRGREYYAPQTLLDPDTGRRIMIGWCGMWPDHPGFTSFGPTLERGWCGHMSLPRVLSLDADLRLCALPAPETALLRRGERIDLQYRLENAEKTLPHAFRPAAEFLLTLEFGAAREGAAGIRLRMSPDGSRGTAIFYDLKNRTLCFDRRASDAVYCDVVQSPLPAPDDSVTLRIFTDTVGAELFSADGALQMTNNLYPAPCDTGAALFCEGCSCTFRLMAWDLGQ